MVLEADAKNDLQSVDRKLDRKLILLIKQKLGDSSHWVMPMGPRSDGESMRQVRISAIDWGNDGEMMIQVMMMMMIQYKFDISKFSYLGVQLNMLSMRI